MVILENAFWIVERGGTRSIAHCFVMTCCEALELHDLFVLFVPFFKLPFDFSIDLQLPLPMDLLILLRSEQSGPWSLPGCLISLIGVFRILRHQIISSHNASLKWRKCSSGSVLVHNALVVKSAFRRKRHVELDSVLLHSFGYQDF